jgi:hypothetical protein
MNGQLKKDPPLFFHDSWEIPHGQELPLKTKRKMEKQVQ